LLLKGELGAGKTAFTRFFCSALGIDESSVASPSFTIMHEYPATPHGVLHADLYRLGPGVDPDDIGLSDYLDGRWIVVVEWGEYLEGSGSAALELEFSYAAEGRMCRIVTTDGEWSKRLSSIYSCFVQEVI